MKLRPPLSLPQVDTGVGAANAALGFGGGACSPRGARARRSREGGGRGGAKKLRPGDTHTHTPNSLSPAPCRAGAFTAHPHVDPARRRLVGWEWTSLAARKAMRFALREWDERWECAARAEYVMEDCMLAPHDFALTRDYYIFVENRMDMAMAPYVLGAKGPAQTLTMRCDDPVRVHVVPRPGGARARDAPRVVECAPWFCIHLCHATQSADGERVSVFASGWPRQARAPDGSPPEFLGAWGGEAPVYDRIPVTHFWRTELELGGAAGAPRVASHAPFPSADYCVEHPHVHPAFEAGVEGGDAPSAPRFAYMSVPKIGQARRARSGMKLRPLSRRSISNAVGLATAPQGWARVDLETGDVRTHWLDTRSFSEEVVLVPKDADAADSAAVWVLGMFYDARRKTSALAVVDGETMERVATLWLKHTSPHGLHGSWEAPARDHA